MGMGGGDAGNTGKPAQEHAEIMGARHVRMDNIYIAFAAQGGNPAQLIQRPAMHIRDDNLNIFSRQLFRNPGVGTAQQHNPMPPLRQTARQQQAMNHRAIHFRPGTDFQNIHSAPRSRLPLSTSPAPNNSATFRITSSGVIACKQREVKRGKG